MLLYQSSYQIRSLVRYVMQTLIHLLLIIIMPVPTCSWKHLTAPCLPVSPPPRVRLMATDTDMLGLGLASPDARGSQDAGLAAGGEVRRPKRRQTEAVATPVDGHLQDSEDDEVSPGMLSISLTKCLVKLALSTKLDTRVLRSICIITYLIDGASHAATAVKAATQSFAVKHKAAAPGQERDRLGSPHIHAWNALIVSAMQHLTDGLMKTQLQAYATKMKGKSQQLYYEVKHVRLAKAWARPGQETKKLELNLREGSDSEQVWSAVLDPWLMKGKPEGNAAVRKFGIAPMGDMERRMQTWLDGHP